MSEGIQIYSTTGEIMYSSSEINNKKKPPRKHRIKRLIINKCFEDMRQYTNEEFWDDILIKFSKNIFSTDFRFINNTLYYKYKNKNKKDEILINEGDLEETFSFLKIFLKKKGILSVKEVVNDNNDLIGDRKKINNWKEVGKNKIYLIHDYILEKGKELDLDEFDKKKLESLLKILIYNSIITHEHIVLENEKIKEIKYLCYDENKKTFHIDIESIKIKPVKQEKKEDNFYLISSFSGDSHNVIINKEIEVENIEKKWDDFICDFYNISKTQLSKK